MLPKAEFKLGSSGQDTRSKIRSREPVSENQKQQTWKMPVLPFHPLGEGVHKHTVNGERGDRATICTAVHNDIWTNSFTKLLVVTTILIHPK